MYNNTIYERLDRAIGSHDLNFIFPNGITYHGNFTVLDHAPIIYDSKVTHNNSLDHLNFKITGL